MFFNKFYNIDSDIITPTGITISLWIKANSKGNSDSGRIFYGSKNGLNINESSFQILFQPLDEEYHFVINNENFINFNTFSLLFTFLHIVY